MKFRSLLVGLVLLAGSPASALEARTIRIGVVTFGTLAWEIDTLRRNSLDAKYGLSILVHELATSESGKIALETGAVDMIVGDWVWVARQRAAGEDLSFIPYSTAVGALVAPQGSVIGSLADLPGKRIGVAGGPLDKSWLILRALCLRELGAVPCDRIEPVFAAPPLLGVEMERGRLDAVLTFWNYAALLEAKGARPVLTVAGMIERLGIDPAVPMLGYVFRAGWAEEHPGLIENFSACSRDVKAILATSDGEWERLGSNLGTDVPAERLALRNGYRAGIPGHWDKRERQSAADLFSILAAIGGRDLVGDEATFDPRVFWAGVAY